jgi:hypothetical protein
MSEHEPGNRAKPSLPFLLESPSTTRDWNIQPFGFGSSNTGMETSFENFNLTKPRPLQHRTEARQQSVNIPAANDIMPAVVIKGKRQTNTRNYKLYVGKTIFFCGGRFLSSRAFWAFALSLFLLVVPSILFLIFT